MTQQCRRESRGDTSEVTRIHSGITTTEVNVPPHHGDSTATIQRCLRWEMWGI